MASTAKRKRPNVVIVMADDLGFSDIGCFGSEIDTPNLDELAENGLRFSAMYNCARCCPSRASLMTGLYPHQAGIGFMVHDACSGADPAYQGYLRDDVVTMAELFQQANYQTYMVGKWHVGGDYPPDDVKHWHTHAGDATHPLPVQRGFDEHYGTLGGAGSYYDPPALIHNHDIIGQTPDDYYYTNEINDQACRMIRKAASSNDDDSSFFLYIAHLAPHWPLHAPPDDIAKYRGRYNQGWDALRQDRYDSLKEKGVIQSSWDCSSPHEKCASWEDNPHKDWEDARMATYAAMIDVMDQGIGRIVQTLRDCHILDNTIIMFLSDNGGCAEFLREDHEDGTWCENYGGVGSDGTLTVVGNNPSRQPGGRDSFMSYDVSWANASNTPFRLFKSWVHEGGIATPFLVHWPAGISNPGRIHHSPWIMMDIVATCYNLCDIVYPQTFHDKDIPPLAGKSFAQVFQNDNIDRGEAMFWEHQGNRAVRDGTWKLVSQHDKEWELFDMEVDRTELNNLATEQPKRVERMVEMWQQWAFHCGVRPWPLNPDEEDWSHRPWDW